jgi:hypothetical protein
MQTSPKFGYELGTTVGDYRLGHSMQFKNVVDVQSCQLVSAIRGMHRYEVRDLCKTVNNHPYRVITSWVLGSPLIKSMLMSTHFHSGMGNSWSNPLGF